MKQLIKKSVYEILILFLIIVISTVHYATASISSPEHSFVRLLYLIPVVLGAFKYGFKGSVLIAIIISLIYAPHILLSFDFSLDTINKLLDILLFFTIGTISGAMIEKRNIRIKTLEDDIRKHKMLDTYTNSIIQSIKSGVVVVNNDMFITIINQGAMDILNIADRCIDGNFMEIFKCCTDIRDKVSKVLNNNIPLENIDISIDENKRFISLSIYPLTLNSTNKGLVIIIDDVTEIKKLQQHIQRADKLAALGELSTGIAHEIRNPLAIIKAIEQTMKNELKHNKEAIKELEIIDEEVERANKIVKSLMEFAKPRRNQMAVDSISELLDEILLIMNKYAAQRNVDFEISKSTLDSIAMDRELLKQAFINIVFNAIDAMPKGGLLRVTTSSEGGKWLKIIFADNGAGIEARNIKKIFNPFFTTKDTGTGLGLSIVHRIIEEHSGIIDVYSNYGEGTRFEILLPIDRKDSVHNEENLDS